MSKHNVDQDCSTVLQLKTLPTLVTITDLEKCLKLTRRMQKEKHI